MLALCAAHVTRIVADFLNNPRKSALSVSRVLRKVQASAFPQTVICYKLNPTFMRGLKMNQIAIQQMRILTEVERWKTLK